MNGNAKGFAPILRFLGAAGTVTGSRFALTTADGVALIDCGLFQGLKELRLRNWDPFPIAPRTIDAVALTHAHLDHSGYLPALCREGFRKRIVVTQGTADLCRVVLPDSGHLQEEEADYANRRGYSKHRPALPLYTEKDAVGSLDHLLPQNFETPVELIPGINVTFRRAGHILGAANVLVEIDGARSRRILFSGDLGRPVHPILLPPAPVPPVDAIVVESTYGDRLHDDEKSLKVFEDAVRRTAERGGVIVIPSFAVDRTEVIIYHLRRLVHAGRIPDLPTYVDSPMALSALHIYREAIARHSPEVRPDVGGDVFNSAAYNEVRTVDESIALNFMKGPMIIISASGMATGGRVLHHLANRLPDKNNTVILVGYQSEGTRGRRLLEGERSIKMLGRYVAVRAEVVDVPAFSVHADQQEIIKWLATAEKPPQVVYVVHGDPPAAQALKTEIIGKLGWQAVIPRYMEQVRLD